MNLILRLAVGLAGGLALTAAARRARRISFRDKVVLITGGSRGLGLVLARQLGAEGARLVLVARNAEELDRAAVELRARGVAVQPVVGDVTLAATAGEAVEAATRAFGRLDVLINNAGIIIVGPLENMTEADYEAALATHLWAPLRFMNAALPHLRRTRGRIVNISSIGGKIAVPHLAPYSASKFALAGLSDAYRAELAKDGVKVTSVFPGLLRTGSHIRALFKGQQEKEFAWFALGMATALTSASAENAARQIIRACRSGTPQLIISVQAKLAVLPTPSGRTSRRASPQLRIALCRESARREKRDRAGRRAVHFRPPPSPCSQIAPAARTTKRLKNMASSAAAGRQSRTSEPNKPTPHNARFADTQ